MTSAILLLPPGNRDRIYGKQHLESLRMFLDLTDCCHLVGNLEALRPHLAEAEIICSGWGMMKMDEEFLDAAPALQAVFYGAGSVRGFLTDAFWEREILLTSAWAANAVPVAETTVSLAQLAMKKMLPSSRRTHRERTFARTEGIRGLYGARVGIIGVGMIGAKVLEMLKRYKTEAFACDPYRSEKEMRNLGAEPMELDELFATCDVVTLHAPNLPSTEHMIRGKHFRSMPEGASFINTARGRLINQQEMIEELKRGRIYAYLDVTDPEPPPSGSPLYELDNVFLTPHLAGAVGDECTRMGALVVDEVKRYCSEEPPAYPVSREMMEWMA